MSSSPDKLPDIIPEPIKKIKSPVIRGGFGTIATPANNIGGDSAWKYRRSSSSATASTTKSTASSAGGSGMTPGAASNNTLFSGLMSHKRNNSDAEAVARRQSFHDQKPATGFLGTWWNKYTTGSQ